MQLMARDARMAWHGPVAQGIEHRFPKPGVARSNRAGVTRKNSGSDGVFRLTRLLFREDGGSSRSLSSSLGRSPPSLLTGFPDGTSGIS